jgi:uncharacterized membrane protein YidH (DUF202 family)
VVGTSRAIAIALTALALALVNLALAYLIVRLAGFSVVGPPMPVAVVVLAVGLLAAAGAVAEWRRYLRRT